MTELLEIELFWHLNCVLSEIKLFLHLTLCIAQSAGAVEYVDCISSEG